MKWHWFEDEQFYYCAHAECIWYQTCQAPETPYDCKPIGVE